MRTAPARSISVTAPSRLHFGMFSFGRQDTLQYGGMGAMIQSPGLRVTVRRGDDFVVEGVHADRARKFADLILLNLCKQRACEHKRAELRRNLHIEVEFAPREHIGLGVGTQLGLAIAAAICSACELRRPSALDLAILSGRGARSGIGTNGFDYGGLLVDAGKAAITEQRRQSLIPRSPPTGDFYFFVQRTLWVWRVRLNRPRLNSFRQRRSKSPTN